MSTKTNNEKAQGISGLLKYGAVVVTMSGLSLHLMGFVTHANFLSRMGVAPGLFPKTSDWLAINGYYTATDRFSLIFQAIAQHLWPLIFTAAIVSLYVFALTQLKKRPRILTCLSELFNFRPEWFADLFRGTFVTVIIYFAIPVVASGLFLLVLVPGILGETAASDIAAKNIEHFSGGCPSAEECTQLTRDGRPIAMGYVIDASESHIAIFDVALGRVRTLETEGLEMIGAKPNSRDPKTKASSKKER